MLDCPSAFEIGNIQNRFPVYHRDFLSGLHNHRVCSPLLHTNYSFHSNLSPPLFCFVNEINHSLSSPSYPNMEMVQTTIKLSTVLKYKQEVSGVEQLFPYPSVFVINCSCFVQLVFRSLDIQVDFSE